MVMLSIIVPVYNVEIYLSKCLDSILNQTFSDFELILVNDGSTDSSRDICSRYLQKDSRIILLDKENGGLSSARNYGLSVASGKYIAFVDSDDWIDLEMYESMINSLEETDTDIIVCGHKVVNFDGTIIDVINTTKESVIYTGLEATKLILKDEKIFSFAWDKIYRRKLFKNITYPIGRIYEDTATTYKLFNKANKVFHLNKAYYYYVRRNDSICHIPGKEILRMQHNFLSFYERYQFVMNHNEYQDISDNCKEKVLKMGFNLIHYHIRTPKIVDEEFIQDLFNKLKEVKLDNNSFISKKYRIEHFLLSNSQILYYKFLQLFFYFK